jgi:hypothetical protein
MSPNLLYVEKMSRYCTRVTFFCVVALCLFWILIQIIFEGPTNSIEFDCVIGPTPKTGSHLQGDQ